MAQTIELLGATYPDVPAVLLPKADGGTASFIDITDTTAVAADVASGKYLYLASGQKVAGTMADGNSLSYGDGRSPYAGIAQVGSAELGF